MNRRSFLRVCAAAFAGAALEAASRWLPMNPPPLDEDEPVPNISASFHQNRPIVDISLAYGSKVW